MTAPERIAVTGEAPSLFDRVWAALGTPGRIGFGVVLGVLVVWLLVLGIRRLGRGGRRSLLIGITGFSFLGLLLLGAFAFRLPEQRGSYFVLWHQIVRVGAVLSGVGFVVGTMALAVPWVLDRVEGRGFVSFVAARHVRAHKSGFLTVISVLSIAGVGVSSFALCAVVAIMGGFGADLKRKILGNNAHIRIESVQPGGFEHWRGHLDDVRLVPGVRAATPVASGEAMASSATNTAGVILRGVDPVTIGTVIDLIQNIEVGKFKYLEQPELLTKLPPDEPIGIGPGGEMYLKGPDIKPYLKDLDPDVEEAVAAGQAAPGIILGRELAKSLHVYVGDELTLVSPMGELGPMGLLPNARRFRVAGIFYSGMYEYDQTQAYVLLETAQEFFDLGHKVTGIEVKVDDPEQVSDVRPLVEQAVADSGLRVRDWKELNKNLFSALKLEKIATFIILSLAILVASFCIICTLLLMVTEKSKEIAILKAIGATDRGILRIFMIEGMMIGGIGTVFGIATGLAATLGLRWFGVRLDPDVYYVDRLPINVDPLDFTIVAVSALLITTLATLYPAFSASRLRPVDGIRYE
ncbi:MAG: ABC transporter permease [Pseudomonadota bacterium]|nr:MAG: ABC transporter permease [Pseudomonadota bacterium]